MYHSYTIPVLVILAVAFLIFWILSARKVIQIRSENLKLLKENALLSKNKKLELKETVKKKGKNSDKASDDEKKDKAADDEKKDSDKVDEHVESEESGSAVSEEKKKSNKEEKDSPVVSELKEKIKTLKADNAKLKEKNFNLSRDNQSLRTDVRSNASTSEQEQRELIELREKNASLTAQLKEVSAKVSGLEKQVQEASIKASEKSETPVLAPAISADSERLTQLQAENASLSTSLTDVRGELASFKRDFKAQLEQAKAEVAESNKSVRKDLVAAQNLAAQAKKREDNNHQIYLIARSQLMLVEKRLSSLDPSYHSQIPLPAKNDAIDEMIKKFVTFNARESRASVDVLNKDKTIEELNERIRVLEKEAAKKSTPVLSLGELDEDDSLSEIVSSFSKNLPDNPSMIPLETPSISGIETASFADLDLSKLDDENWGL